MSGRSGTLYLCATPIGNLGDITGRVLDTLKEADIIACEDTRNSRKLFSHFGIAVTPLTAKSINFFDQDRDKTAIRSSEMKTKFANDSTESEAETLLESHHDSDSVTETENFIESNTGSQTKTEIVSKNPNHVSVGRTSYHRKYITSYHDHNRYDKARELADYLHRGFNVALVTDAGMPAISDPGYELVALCHEEGLPVTALPGACALVAALALSGISPRRFVFEGFLPDKKERERILNLLRDEERTIILYEAPHHMKKTLKELASVLGDNRKLALCRELTKKFEEVRQCTIGEAISFYNEQEPRGEYVLVIEGKSHEKAEAEKRRFFEEMSLREHVEMYEAQGADKKEAMKRAAADRGLSKRDVYNALLKL